MKATITAKKLTITLMEAQPEAPPIRSSAEVDELSIELDTSEPLDPAVKHFMKVMEDGLASLAKPASEATA